MGYVTLLAYMFWCFSGGGGGDYPPLFQIVVSVHTITEVARCVGCLCTSSGWFKHIEPHQTYMNHTITEIAMCVGYLCISSGCFKHMELHRTYTNHTITEIARCVRQIKRHQMYTNNTITRFVRYLCTNSRLFKHQTYTNHTSTEIAWCVGCLCISSGWFTSNLNEPHQHRDTWCVGCLCTSSGLVQTH